MEIFDFFNISERHIELINPFSPEKILTVGKILGLKKGAKVIEFGCGYGEVLALWARQYNISGKGIDIREHVCRKAKRKMTELGFNDRIEIVCMDAAKYEFEKGAYDVAACIGASFIWEGYEKTVQTMKTAIQPKGKLAIGEPYWQKEPVPSKYMKLEPSILTEYELLKIARKEGFDFEYIVRANRDDWDRYETCNWYGLVRWLEENPEHPERQEVIDHLHKVQDEYIKFGREYIGWGVYVLNKVKY